MLQVSQELISSREPRVFRSGQQILVAQTHQRKQRAAVLEPGFAPAMEPLQALHQKLDVANASAGKLHIELGALLPGSQLLSDSNARLRDRFHGRKVERRRVDARFDELQEFAARLRLA